MFHSIFYARRSYRWYSVERSNPKVEIFLVGRFSATISFVGIDVTVLLFFFCVSLVNRDEGVLSFARIVDSEIDLGNFDDLRVRPIAPLSKRDTVSFRN